MLTERQVWAIRLAAAELDVKSRVLCGQAEVEQSQVAGEVQSYANDLDEASGLLREMLREGVPALAAK